MHADLDRLIRLQTLDLELDALRRASETEVERRQALEADLDAQRGLVAAAHDRLTESQHERRAREKDLAQVQGRLSKYRDQLMAVKTNKEYTAMQAEIAAAEGEVRKLEDEILERMVEGDELTAAVKKAEADLRVAEGATKLGIQGLADEVVRARERLTSAVLEREALAGALPRDVLTEYASVTGRRGSAVAEVREGHCTICHVRLRPKVYQDVRRNDSILQCDSCHRFLYYVPPPAQPATPPAS